MRDGGVMKASRVEIWPSDLRQRTAMRCARMGTESKLV